MSRLVSENQYVAMWSQRHISPPTASKWNNILYLILRRPYLLSQRLYLRQYQQSHADYSRRAHIFISWITVTPNPPWLAFHLSNYRLLFGGGSAVWLASFEPPRDWINPAEYLLAQYRSPSRHKPGTVWSDNITVADKPAVDIKGWQFPLRSSR